METLTVAGHALAAACFAVLAGLLATRWRDRMRGSLLLVAVVVTVAWGGVIASNSGDPGYAVLAADVAKALAWILFLTQALGGISTSRVSLLLRFGPWGVGAAALAIGAWALHAPWWEPPLGVFTFDRTYVLAGLALSIFGLVLVEQVLRNTRDSQAWSVKFVWLGVGVLFGYDLVLFSTSYVLNEVERTLEGARGLAVTLAVPLLAIGVTRVKDFRPQVLMSQQLAFYTTSVVLAGLFLLAVSIAGYYVRALGGSWGGALQVLLVFAAVIGVAVVVFSGTARASLRVWLAKHWFPYKYDYRNEWLDLTSRLAQSEDGSSLHQRIVEAFRRLGRATVGALMVSKDDVLQPVAGTLMSPADAPSAPLSKAFVGYLVEHEWIVDLDRARAGDGRDAELPLPGWLQAMADAWLAIPLLHERRLVGLVVLGRPLVPERLTWEDLDLLRTAARQAASYLALEQAADELARERQFAALNRFTAFLMHDLSNILAQQRLIVENAARHKHNPAFVDDAIETIDNTVKRMSRLLEQLKTGQAAQPARRVELAATCRHAVARTADREPKPTLDVRDESAAALVAGDRLEHVLDHVIRNAQDATPPGGRVHVTVRTEGESAVIDVTDSGKGMDPEFIRDRLFRPFDTTKGAKGMGIGAFQAREFARSAGGDVRVSSTPGSGTTFVIVLPRVR